MTSLSNTLTLPLLGLLVAFGPLSIDMYLPSLPNIADSLGATDQRIQSTITVFLMGMAIGMLFFGPLSDLLGRKRLLLLGIGVYFFSSIGCALAHTGEQLILFRFLQSLGGAAAAVLGRALVRDFFELTRAAAILSHMHVVSMMVMLASPILGAYIVSYLDWRWIFYFLAFFSTLAFVGSYLLLPESKQHVRNHLSLKTYVNNYFDCIRAPRLVLYTLTNALSFGGMFAFIATSAFIYIEHYGVSETHYAMLFSGNIIAIIVATLGNSWLSKHYSIMVALTAAMMLSFTATLFIWLLYGLDWTPLLFFIGVTMLYISVTGAIGANSLATLFLLLPEKAGTVSGLFIASQFAIGSLVSYVASALFDGTPSSLLLIMACCGSLSMLLYLRANRL
ncbi:multidrug effflux MFS transporter [Marinomonas sp. IMCC 4694]|uniref:multidrug effflux MFS transporter n=1 Tax=Marinomonas sp. IMCC 4694 TaxID=2605432 RepID=UPI0011E75F35|nr:multidrug effflux MFS transporter [Marinomonas sp. IMCC 4694]TYL47683.1 multidrug effflux MFS transporter [Marinomonas sp. IMCC 4694]